MDLSDNNLNHLSRNTKFDLAICSHRYFSFERDQHEQDNSTHFVEKITWALARDNDVMVRQKLSETLSTCENLPLDLAEEIASDIASVAIPFLTTTNTFTDKQMANLIPFLKEYAVSVLAQRSDIKPQTIYAIAVTGEAKSVTHLVANKFIALSENTIKKIMARFSHNQYLIDRLADRLDLPPTTIEDIISLVSPLVRNNLTQNYSANGNIAAIKMEISDADWLYAQVRNANPQQIHSIAINLRQNQKLKHVNVLKVAERGYIQLLESTLALESGETLATVREILTLKDKTAFVNLLRQAGFNKNLGPYVLRILKNTQSILHNHQA